MNIAISGCGISGASAGFLLAEAGHQVTIFEQAPACQAIGAGILLSPSGQDVLRKWGLLSFIESRAAPLKGLTAKTASGRSIIEIDYRWLHQRPPTTLTGLGVHRGLLFELLLARCQSAGVQIRNGFLVERCDLSTNDIRVFNDTGEHESGFDFLIAADGSRSRLRQQLAPSSAIVDYDFAALWATADCSYQPERLVQVVNGTRQLLGLLPIGNARSSFFWGLPADGLEALKTSGFGRWKSEVLRLFPAAESIFESIRNFDDLTFARYRHVRMPSWNFPRVVFLGDAAHATSPHLGQGVNLALEDVACFVDALGATDDHLEAGRNFQRIRSRKLRYYQRLTYLLTPFFQSQHRLLGWGRDVFLPWMPHVPIVRREMLRTFCGYKNGWLS